MRVRIALLLMLVAGAAHADDTVDAEKWLKARGFTGELDPIRQPDGCIEIKVGKEHEPALICTEIEQTSAGGEDIPVTRVVTHRTINVVRAGKLVVVLDASIRYEPFDGLPGFKNGQPVFRAFLSSELTVARDGMSAMIAAGDTADLWGCAHPQKAGGKEWERADAKKANAMCAERGAYVWTKRGRFEKKR